MSFDRVKMEERGGEGDVEPGVYMNARGRNAERRIIYNSLFIIGIYNIYI